MGGIRGAFGGERLGDPVEDLIPLRVDRSEVGLGIEDGFDDDVAFLGELRAAVCDRESHGDIPPGIGSSNDTSIE